MFFPRIVFSLGLNDESKRILASHQGEDAELYSGKSSRRSARGAPSDRGPSGSDLLDGVVVVHLSTGAPYGPTATPSAMRNRGGGEEEVGVGGKGEKVDPRRPPGEIGRRVGRFEGLDTARDIFLSFRKENGHLTMIKVSITK